MNNIKSILLLTVAFFTFSAQAEQGTTVVTFTSCVGGFCSPNTSDSPLAATGNEDYDAARYHAYRQEYGAKYQEESERLKAQTERWAREKKEAEGLSTEEFDALLATALSELESNLPKLPNVLPTLEQRRQANPYPSLGDSKKDLDAALDEVWAKIKDQQPQAVAEEIETRLRSYRPVEGLPEIVNRAREERGTFYEKELTLSHILDGNGLINAPFVDPPIANLRSNPLTAAGFETRMLMNHQIANQSVYQAKCLANQATEADCAVMGDFHQTMTMSLLAMDRWAANFKVGRPADMNRFNIFLKALEAQIMFAEGFIEQGTDTLLGIKEMLSHPVATAEAILSAAYNYDKTAEAIFTSVTDLWDEYQSADAAGKAKIYGKLGFEVLSALFPANLADKVAKAAKVSSGVANVMAHIGKAITRTDVLPPPATLDGLHAVSEVVQKSLNKFPNESIDEIVDSSKIYFKGWRRHFELRAVESAEDANIRHFSLGNHQPPYESGTKVFHFVTKKDEVFERVHHAGNKTRDFMMRKEAIIGLTPEQLQVKYALPELPTHYSEVHVPAGFPLTRGKVGANEFGQVEGAVQYRLEKFLDKNYFVNTKPIEGVVH